MFLKKIKDIIVILIKLFFLLFIIMLQYYFYKLMLNQLCIYIGYIYILLTIIEILLIIYMFNKQTTLEYIVLWLTLFIIFPILGIGVYIIFSTKTILRNNKKYIKEIHDNSSNNNIEKDNEKSKILNDINNKDVDMYNTIKYINNECGYNVKKSDINKYYESGEAFYSAFLNDIKNAKKYIFINFFIIAKSRMLNEILEVLKNKAENGVKVFVIFDHMGSIARYPKALKKVRINNFNVCVFNPISSNISMYFNIRNHRKIVVIDGNISYTGGVNIADEYINNGSFKAKWKDCAIRLEGNIANDFSSIFIKLWNMYCKKNERMDINDYVDKNSINANNVQGYQIVYLDGLDTKTNVGKNLYSKLINDAQRFVYIMSPYLMLDNEMLNSLKICGRRGIDVRIITPKVGDNFLVHLITRSYYRELIENNVKIYEYIPGFIHSKTILSDDIKTSISSINLDYRSLYFHYECGVLIYDNRNLIGEVKNDFVNTFNECEQIDYLWVEKHFVLKIFKPILKIIAPIM